MQFRFEMSILNQTWSFSKQNQQSAFSTPNTFFFNYCKPHDSRVGCLHNKDQIGES